jgi:hypothetical protein
MRKIFSRVAMSVKQGFSLALGRIGRTNTVAVQFVVNIVQRGRLSKVLIGEKSKKRKNSSTGDSYPADNAVSGGSGTRGHGSMAL